MRTDNDISFVVADREIKPALLKLQQQKITDTLGQNNIS